MTNIAKDLVSREIAKAKQRLESAERLSDETRAELKDREDEVNRCRLRLADLETALAELAA